MSAPGADDGRRPRATWMVLSLLLLAVVFAFALPRVASYEEAWHEIEDADRVGWLLLAAVWNIVSYWFLLVAALPGLTFRQAAIANQASTAISNTVPGGAGLGMGITYAMYRRWGFGADETARSFLLSGAWNNYVKLAMPVMAGVVVIGGGQGEGALALAAVCVAVLVGSVALASASLRGPGGVRRLALQAERLATAGLRIVGRGPASGWTDAAERMRLGAAEIVRRRWHVLTAAAVVSHSSLFFVLLASLRSIGVGSDEVSWPEALVAFAVVRAALMLPLTPGGAGLTELGLAGMLVGAGGAHEGVVAAVLVFRALTWLLPVVLGAAAYIVWLRERAPVGIEAR